MSERRTQSDRSDQQPLFQNTDDQEQAYAPQQVPGNAIPAHEEDADADAGRAAHGRADAPAFGVIPAVPAGDISASTPAAGPGSPLIVPVVPTESQVDEEDRR